MRIALTQLGCIGDAILLSSCLAAIAKQYPGCEIDVIAGQGNYFIFEGHPAVNRVLVYRKSLVGLFSFVRQLRREEYDYYVDPKDHYSSESRIIAKLIRARKKIGFNKQQGNPFDVPLPNQVDNRGKHYISRLFEALVHAGIPFCGELPRPWLALNDDSVRFAEEFIACTNSKILLVNISAGSTDRIWQTEKWTELLAEACLKDYDKFATSTPADKAEATKLCDHTGARYFETRNFHDLVAMIARAQLLLTPDTAAVHVASAFNTPMVAIYGGRPDNTAKYYPLSRSFAIAEAEEGTDSVADVSVNDARNALARLLGTC